MSKNILQAGDYDKETGIRKITFRPGRQMKVLCLFDYLATTGFATVSQNIVDQLRKRFGEKLFLEIVPINYFGKITKNEAGEDEQVIEPEIWIDEYTHVIPPKRQEIVNNPYGQFTFLRLLNQGNYDGIFIIQDPGVVVAMMPNLEEIWLGKKFPREGRMNRMALVEKKLADPELRATAVRMMYEAEIEQIKKELAEMPEHPPARPLFKSMFYFPVDSRPLSILFSDQEQRDLSYFDRLIPYTEYGRKEVLAQRPDLADKMAVIPHGVNTKEFYPISVFDIQDFRQEYFGENNARKYIICNINRNQFRKDIPNTMLAFKHYLTQYNSDAFLYLHMTPLDQMGWDLRVVADQLQLIEGVHFMFAPEKYHNAAAPVTELNKIYNACDLFLTTTTGEGWGLTVLEAMACQLPVIAPNNSSLTEIGGYGSRMYALEEFYPYCSIYDSVIREQCSFEEVAELISKARLNEEETRQKVVAAYHYAVSLSWDNVCDRWEEEFKNLYW